MIIVHMADGTQQPIEAASWQANEHWATFEMNSGTKVFIPTARIKMILQISTLAAVPVPAKNDADKAVAAAVAATNVPEGANKGRPN